MLFVKSHKFSHPLEKKLDKKALFFVVHFINGTALLKYHSIGTGGKAMKPN
jgi:hypothetical protein